jgi:hypothetical protein
MFSYFDFRVHPLPGRCRLFFGGLQMVAVATACLRRRTVFLKNVYTKTVTILLLLLLLLLRAHPKSAVPAAL